MKDVKITVTAQGYEIASPRYNAEIVKDMRRAYRKDHAHWDASRKAWILEHSQYSNRRNDDDGLIDYYKDHGADVRYEDGTEWARA